MLHSYVTDMAACVTPTIQIPSHVDLGVRVDTDLKFHSHIRETANKAGGIAQNLLKGTNPA